MSSRKSSIRADILREFLNDYPHSAQIRGGRSLRKGRWDRIFPDIESDPEMKDEFLSAAEELEAKGILSIKWARHRQGDRIEALYLEDPARLYEMLGLPSPEQQREESLALLKEFCAGLELRAGGGHSRFTADLIEHLQARLEAFIPTPCDDPESLGDLLTFLTADRGMIAELPLRALSIRLYNDSKRLERLVPQADKLSMSAAGEKLSALFGLARTYPQAALRGHLELVLQDGQVWKLGGEPLFFGPALAERPALISAESPVLVVENKESFMTLPFEKCGFSGLIYGGGHLNSVAVKLLQIAEQSGIKLYYFGDLDPDGLLIFQQAESLLDGQLIPWKMDGATYRRYKRFGYPLSEGSMARLAHLHEARFAEIRKLMEEHGLGVEQEVIDVLSPE